MSNKVCPYNCVADCSECELEEKKLKTLEILKDEFEINFNDKEQTINFQSVEYPYPHIRFSLTREIKDKDKYNLLKEVLL